ncbi:MAG: CPBP family intramembrane glutamic endopeptidase, partial [Bacteroidota bacterium]
ELIFRGFFVIGMAKVLGKGAVLPMVSIYAARHFAKPMLETVGSVFGGYILGVIAFRSQNIWGGVLIHIGIAALMDVFALLQRGYLL